MEQARTTTDQDHAATHTSLPQPLPVALGMSKAPHSQQSAGPNDFTSQARQQGVQLPDKRGVIDRAPMMQ